MHLNNVSLSSIREPSILIVGTGVEEFFRKICPYPIQYGVIQNVCNGREWVGMHYFCDKLLRKK